MSNLDTIYQSSIATFAGDGTAVQSAFGWRAQRQHPTGTQSRRVVWVPGDDKGKSDATTTDAGNIAGARSPGGLPRSLATFREIATVYCWAVEKSFPESESIQYAEARTLWDAWYRAVYLSARGRFEVTSTQWITRQLERRWGAALRSVIVIDTPVLDAPLGSDVPNQELPGATLGRIIDVEQQDHNENL